MDRFGKPSCIVHDEKDSVSPDNSNEINITDIRAQLFQIQQFMTDIYCRLKKIEDGLAAFGAIHLQHLDKSSKSIQQNMNQLNGMISEFKGLVAIVRPEVKKTGWYGEEFGAKGESISKPIEIGRCNVEIDGVDRLGVTRKKLT